MLCEREERRIVPCVILLTVRDRRGAGWGCGGSTPRPRKRRDADLAYGGSERELPVQFLACIDVNGALGPDK